MTTYSVSGETLADMMRPHLATIGVVAKHHSGSATSEFLYGALAGLRAIETLLREGRLVRDEDASIGVATMPTADDSGVDLGQLVSSLPGDNHELGENGA
jgi:hypothetical protein